jgi:hypothetical protein
MVTEAAEVPDMSEEEIVRIFDDTEPGKFLLTRDQFTNYNRRYCIYPTFSLLPSH